MQRNAQRTTRSRTFFATALLALGAFAGAPAAQSAPADGDEPNFTKAAEDIDQRLEASLQELSRLRQQIQDEKLPLSRRLSALEAELSAARGEYEQATREQNERGLALSNLKNEIESRRKETSYLSTLLGDYIRNFESRLHIAEAQRYEDALVEARLAPDNSNLSEQEVFETQAELLGLSIERLQDALAGATFPGTAVGEDGLVKKGTFLLLGHSALFLSDDGSLVGTADEVLGSAEPRILPFADPLDADAARTLVAGGVGSFPLDPTMGNAHKIEAIEETFLEHVKKGGPVMIPIFAMAGAALLIALYKWISFLLVRRPSRKAIAKLLAAVGENDAQKAREHVAKIRGPVGAMLSEGVEHLEEPRDLIEEVMYENVLTTKLKLQRMLPFIAICAASAPLLGLLGTVTGIINTFKMITVFGSGDVKSLSGGISEALITTKFGLIVAIPSLLLHAFLSRKARGIVSQMEATGIAFVNRIRRGGSEEGSFFGDRADAPAGTERPGQSGRPEIPSTLPEESELTPTEPQQGKSGNQGVRGSAHDVLTPQVDERSRPRTSQR